MSLTFGITEVDAEPRTIFIAKVLNYIFMEHNAKSVIKPENAIL